MFAPSVMIELRPATAVADEAGFDRLGPERREQRLIDRAHPPGAERHGEQLRNPWQQSCDDVAFADAAPLEQVGDALGGGFQRRERHRLALHVAPDPLERAVPVRRPSIAAFDSRIEPGREAPLEQIALGRCDGSRPIGGLIVVHGFLPRTWWRTIASIRVKLRPGSVRLEPNGHFDLAPAER